MSRNVHLFFDGTWQKEDQADATNVAKLYGALAPDQPALYQPGVGTGFLHFTGGLFGVGLSRDIIDAYEWVRSLSLNRHDRLTVVGFSRGAYAARSFCGMLWSVGIRPGNAEKLFAMYRKKRRDEHTAAAVANTPRVGHLFVMDTVGALGVPTPIGWVPVNAEFHDTRPSPLILRGTHVVAMHETRRHFTPTLFDLSGEGAASRILEVWAPGVHCDVGGGGPRTWYSDQILNMAMSALSSTGSVFRSSAKRHVIQQLLSTPAEGRMRNSVADQFCIPHRKRVIPEKAQFVRWC